MNFGKRKFPCRDCGGLPMNSYDAWAQTYDALVRRKTPGIELPYDREEPQW